MDSEIFSRSELSARKGIPSLIFTKMNQKAPFQKVSNTKTHTITYLQTQLELTHPHLHKNSNLKPKSEKPNKLLRQMLQQISNLENFIKN